MIRFKLTLCMAFLVIAASSASASTFIAMSPEELVKSAEDVVVGYVLETYTHWNAERTKIITEVHVAVEEAVLGEPAGTVVIRTLGGEIDGMVSEVHGYPKFQPNERVLIFLKQRDDGLAHVVGYSQGHYRVIPAKDGRDLAVPTVDDKTLLLTRRGTPAPRPTTLPLAELKQKIRDQAMRLGRAAD